VKTYVVFYGTQVYGEYTPVTWPDDLPDGAYAITPFGNWIRINHGIHLPCDPDDVPAVVKTLALILGR